MNMFTMVLGMLCNSNFWIYLWASRYPKGALIPYLVLYSCMSIIKDPPSCLPSSRFRVSTGTPWAVVPGMYRTHCKHNSLFHHQFSITTSTYSYMDVCGMEHTPVYILKYMGQMSNNNNNKVLINNS